MKRWFSLTTFLQRRLNLPAEGSVISVRRMRVRVFRLAHRVRAAGRHAVQVVVVVVVGVRVHVRRSVRLLRRVKVLRVVHRALPAVEARVCGGGLRQGRGGVLGGDGAPRRAGQRRFLVLKDRRRLTVHFKKAIFSAAVGVGPVRSKLLLPSVSVELAFPNSLDAAASQAVHRGGRRPTQQELLITGRAELSQARQDREEWMSASHWLPSLCPKAKTVFTVACLAPFSSPQKLT